MNKCRIVSILFLVLFVIGLSPTSANGEDKADRPIIHDAFAAKQISPYETWKVYLKVSDPDGDMRSIYAVVEQTGIGPYPLSITRLKSEYQREFSGYVYLNSSGSDVSALNHALVSLTIWIQDRRGNFSEPVNFSVSLNSRHKQEPPPPGRFEENELGPILVLLRVPYGSSKPWNF